LAKVLVTGAAGQVGCRLVRQLLARNYEVRALILPDDPARGRLDGLEVELIEGNLMDFDLATKVVDGVDAVIHTANLVGRPAGMSESDFFDNNVRNTLHIVRAASKRADSLTRLVHISSSSVYPNDTQNISACYHPVDERHPLRFSGVYALSKMVGEEIVAAHARETRLQTAIIRPTHVRSMEAILERWTVRGVVALLKTGQANPQSDLFMADGRELWRDLEGAARSPEQPCAITDDAGRPWMYQPVDARDVALGCICALEHPAAVGEAFNVSAPRPYTFPEAAELLAQHLGQAVLPWRTPVRWVYDLDNTKARALIGYQPRWDLPVMVADALAVRRGESDGMSQRDLTC